jgi:hypothetical protein
MFYPPFNFAKIFQDISYVSTLKYSNNNNIFNGFSFELFVKEIYIESFDVYSPPVYHSILYLILNSLIFLILAWYFHNIIEDDYKPALPFYFFLNPYYYFKKKKNNFNQNLYDDINNVNVNNEKYKNIQMEYNNTIENEKLPIRILGLTKIYQKYPIFPTKYDFKAISNLYLSIDYGTCLGLLGKYIYKKRT